MMRPPAMTSAEYTGFRLTPANRWGPDHLARQGEPGRLGLVSDTPACHSGRKSGETPPQVVSQYPLQPAQRSSLTVPPDDHHPALHRRALWFLSSESRAVVLVSHCRRLRFLDVSLHILFEE